MIRVTVINWWKGNSCQKTLQSNALRTDSDKNCCTEKNNSYRETQAWGDPVDDRRISDSTTMTLTHCVLSVKEIQKPTTLARIYFVGPQRKPKPKKSQWKVVTLMSLHCSRVTRLGSARCWWRGSGAAWTTHKSTSLTILSNDFITSKVKDTGLQSLRDFSSFNLGYGAIVSRDSVQLEGGWKKRECLLYGVRVFPTSSMFTPPVTEIRLIKNFVLQAEQMGARRSIILKNYRLIAKIREINHFLEESNLFASSVSVLLQRETGNLLDFNPMVDNPKWGEISGLWAWAQLCPSSFI